MEEAEFERRLEEIYETGARDYIKLSRSKGKDVIAMFAEHGLTGDEAFNLIKEHLKKIMTDSGYYEEFFGHTPEEGYLMNDGLTLEQARYVIANPCLDNAQDRCVPYKEDGKCVLFGCTLRNGWLYYRIEDGGKWIPIYSSWEKLPKDTLYLSDESIKDGSWEGEVDSLLRDLEIEKETKESKK